MKVILLQDVAKIGRRFELVTVPDGYAMNMLIPKHMAEPATPQNIKRLSSQTAKAEAAEATVSADFDQAVVALEGKTISVAVELNDKGHMFEALKPATIVEALQEMGVTVPVERIQLDSPIKEAGDYKIALVAGAQSAPLSITVEKK